MNNIQQTSGADLLREGLKSYQDAKYAMRAFEAQIQNAALSVMTTKFASIKKALGSTEILKRHLSFCTEDCELGQVAIGAIGRGGNPWEEGLRLGIGWQIMSGYDGLRPIVSLSIRIGADWKRDKIFGVLKEKSSVVPREDVSVEQRRAPSTEVSLQSPLAEEAGIENIKEKMNIVVDKFVKWSESFGGLRCLLYNENCHC